MIQIHCSCFYCTYSPSVESVAFELKSLRVKTTSPESEAETDLIVKVYLRPLLLIWKRPPSVTGWPFKLQEHFSELSRDKIHSNVQFSPALASIDLRRLVIPMWISGVNNKGIIGKTPKTSSSSVFIKNIHVKNTINDTTVSL